MYKPINFPHCGKIIPEYMLTSELTRNIVRCPNCSSQRNCKDGKRQTNIGKIQLYLCSDCGHRFS